jgi:hypothetical protein
MRRAARLLIALSALLPALPVAAGEMVPGLIYSRPVKAVVELFTSQGCSSCPPADAILKSLAEEKGVLALSLPVDYWDFLGWKDTLANPKNTERQRSYAKVLGIGSVYTPQAVINGVTQVVGSRRGDVEAAIAAESKRLEAARVPVRFWRQGDIFAIELGAATLGSGPRRATVWLGVVQKLATVAVKRGENAGTTLTYANVVRELVPVGIWEGTPKALQLSSASVIRPESEDAFVIIQQDGQGPVIGAAWLGH